MNKLTDEELHNLTERAKRLSVHSIDWSLALSVATELQAARKKQLVSNIRLCWLPYQPKPFVVGDGEEGNVWLLDDGTWTREDGHERSPLNLGSWVPPSAPKRSQP